jgi:hypothetical protein
MSNNQTDAFIGRLEAFFETGTEGVRWSIYNESIGGYEGLEVLQDGDILTVYSSDESNVIWEGTVKYEYDRLVKPSRYNPEYKQQAIFGMWVNGFQHDLEPAVWARWFFDKLPAKVTRKV